MVAIETQKLIKHVYTPSRVLHVFCTSSNVRRIFAMKKTPDPHEYDQIVQTRRNVYNRKKKHQRQICDFLKEKAVLAHQSCERSTKSQFAEYDFIPISQEKYVRELRRHAEKITPSPPIAALERKIVRLVPRSAAKKFPHEVDKILAECKKEWNENLHRLAVKMTVRDVVGVDRKPFVELPFKYGGRTENYPNYSRTRAIIRRNLTIVHPLMRKILDTSTEMFPPFLVDMTDYRRSGFVDCELLKRRFSEDLAESENFISHVWFVEIVEFIKTSKYFKNVSDVDKTRKLLRGASHLISTLIIELMRRSIEHLLCLTRNPKSIPLLNIDAKYKDCILSEPSIEDIIDLYVYFFKSISSICQILPSLENLLKEVDVSKFITVKLNDMVFDEYVAELIVHLRNIFNPIEEYLTTMKKDFSGLIESPELRTYGISEEDFLLACEKIDVYKTFINKLSTMVDNEYFEVGKLCQIQMLEYLKTRALKLESEILNSLCLSHKKQSLDICNRFEEMAEQLKATPKDVAELMSNGAYSMHVTTVVIKNMNEKIFELVKIMGELLEMATISGEHLEINTKMINWLKEIEPIVEESAVNYETGKYEMEEALMEKTKVLTQKISDVYPYISILDEMDNINNTLPYLEDIRRLVHRIEDCEKDVCEINAEETTFKFPLTTFTELEDLKKYVLPFYNLVYLLHKWRRSYYSWMDGPFEYIDNVQVEEQHEAYMKEFTKIFRDYKNQIKQQITDGNEMRFKGLVEDPDPMNLPAPMKLCAQALKELKEWRPCVQIVNIMCNPALKKRHWDEMSKIAGFDLTPNAGTTIRKIVDFNIGGDLQKYEIISLGACKELILFTNLETMVSEWKEVKFEFGTYKDTDIKILKKLDTIQTILDDHLIKAISMRGSPFVKPFEIEVKSWYEKLTRINSSIDEWGKVQHRWLYFLPLFSSKNVTSQMAAEAIMFQEVNNTYLKYMGVAMDNPLVLKLAGEPGLLEALENANNLLEKINDGVNKYVENKRIYFPRFFFLSIDEILEILSETTDPTRVQPHLIKCFEGINSLEFDADYNVLEIISKEKEHVTLAKRVSTIDAGGSVEIWLLNLEKEMFATIYQQVKLSYKNSPNTERINWIKRWEGMVILCVSQIYWATSVHYYLTDPAKNMQEFYTVLDKQLKDLVNLIRSPSLTNSLRVSIKALIVIDVHAADIIEELMKKNVCSDTDFNWLAQLRYYWEDENVKVKIINAVVKYGYEYLGNSDRLVITPLTDRCYRTLIGAYNLHLNGAPEGPAGTGKTETTKDLAKALAIHCLVFNCSEGLDYKSMGRFFKGIASNGAWACFDEFNRIDVEVLSVIAQQILCIIQAVRQKLTVFNFEGTSLSLNPTCYVCITMNPGYAGRSELPDNLKVLFRTIAMMVPDYALIAQISLYSYGFLNAKDLSIKLVTTYRLSSEQLSSQNHYDYGMRAVKAVLTACGNNKIKSPEENEELILLQSIRDVNLPKFLTFDVPLFEAIIVDVFPFVKITEESDEKFLSTVKDVCEKMNLVATDYFMLKINQTRSMMYVRHGFMLVGGPYSGKTSVLKVLYESLFDEHSANECVVINPKSIHIDRLYGAFDRVSQEWNDGIIGKIFRTFARSDKPGVKWFIFDGPIDAVWIENLNTVLDDSKKLCLISGEVIGMSSGMSMIFETMDLSQASPATVSRCGMIYMDPRGYNHVPYVKSWINNKEKWKENFENLLYDLCDWIFPPTTEFLRKIDRPEITGGEVNSLMTTLYLVDMLMNDALAAEDDGKHIKIWIQASFIFATIWGLGGNLPSISKAKFDEFVKEFWKNDQAVPESLEKVEVLIPSEGSLYDYFYQFKLKGSWKNWSELVKTTKILEAKNLHETIIPTVDALKCSYLLDFHVRYKKPLAFIGPTGTGKTFYIRDFVSNKLAIKNFTPIFLTFTSTTAAHETQEFILSKLFKLNPNQFGPTRGKRAILFIDDVSMPAKEIYGAQPPIELLRQYLDYGYIFDLKILEKVEIINLLLFTAMGLVGGSKQLIYPRFLRHFNLFNIEEFNEETMSRIFTNILQIGFRRNGFGNEVTPLIVSIVNGSLNIYASVKQYLFPTVAKPHYMFNLRDICRVVQGCSLLKKDPNDCKKIVTKLWVHEIMRVFYDRLISQSDREWFYSLLKKCLEDNFKESINSACDNYRNNEGIVTEESIKDLMFGTYLDLDSLEDDRKYEEIPSIEVLYNRASAALQDYNDTHKQKMNIVLFKYALEHLSKICRIFSIPGGSALLIGMSGSGRQSLTKLASAMLGKTLFQPEITKDYDFKKWKDDIKYILKQSGGMAKDVIFLFTDSQIIDERFIQNIDSLLNSGEVPNLFDLDEQQEILEMVQLAAQGGNRNLDVSPIQVMSYFTNRCKNKLHICMCLSPIGSSFRDRLRLYPTLVDCCTIDWFDFWPEDALEQVAKNHMEELNFDEDIKFATVNLCKYFHVYAQNISNEYYKTSRTTIYVTSGGYLDLMKLFIKLITEKQNETLLAKQRYVNGLDKIELAAEAVSKMQNELNDLKPQLIIMAQRGVEMTKEIEKETIEADKATVQVKEDEKIANEQAAASQELKKDCEADLALAIPILEDAIDALNTLKPTDITLVKSMKNPPAAIKLVMAAVCVMLSIPPDRVPDPANPGRKMLDYWGPSKRVLGDMAFLQNLKDYDKDNIPTTIMAKIRKEYLPHKDFKPKIIAKASAAAEGLCKWVIAMDMYDAVAKVVAPKKAKLSAAEAEFAATMAILQEKKEMVARLEKKVADLNAALEEANLKRQQLEDEVQHCVNKLYRAEKLIGGLGGEKSRWIEVSETLQALYDNLAGDILISCGIIAYLPSFPTNIRQVAIKDWIKHTLDLNIPISKEFSFTKVLGNDIKIQNWYINSLPRDQISTENAIIQDVSLRWSLLIDPQTQANRWIKTMEKENDLHVIRISDDDYMKKLQKCMENGLPALIENISNDIPTPLDPILLKNTYSINEQHFMTLGSNDIFYNNNFRLYMTTKLRNPVYSPDVFNKVTLVNFALSIEGLQDQLLGIVVAKERPDLQEKREQLIIESAQNASDLKNVEDSILRTLQESKGDILEDEGAIEILDTSKALAVDILKRNEAAKETESIIEDFRKSYLPIAEHSANLYYSVTDLPNVNSTYQFSLMWFINLYIQSIKNANKSTILEKRIKFLIETFTYTLYSNVCRSLFEKDKILFSFILCYKMLLMSREIKQKEFNFMITRKMEPGTQNNLISWLPQASWNELCSIELALPAFKGLKQSIIDKPEPWKKIYESLEPQNKKLPSSWDVNLTLFQKLLVLKIIRPDKFVDAIILFIEKSIGKQYTTPPSFDIMKSFNDSSCFQPLIFILSPGVNPIEPLTKFAEKMGLAKKLNSLSLGQDQGPIASKLISEAKLEGGWVCLQNCHLSISWLPELENIIESFDITNTDLSFRLWLTTYPSEKLPQSILLSAIKMTNEPPSGLKNNLNRLYTSEPIKDPSFYEGCPGKYEIFSKLLYGVSFFHAVIQERKKFGPLGWNIPYGFDDSDYFISIMQLQVFLNQYETVQYEALTYLIGECNYGGRVTDVWDRRLISTILKDYINSDVISDGQYSFYQDLDKYGLPIRYEHGDYVNHIDSIPDYSSPMIFGLNINAGIVCDFSTSNGLLESIRSIQGQIISDDKTDDFESLSTDIIERLPPLFEIEAAEKKYSHNRADSLNIFLIQEMDRYNRLLGVIVTSLINMQRGIKGIVVMTPELENEIRSIMLGRIPEKWNKHSYPSLKSLASYVADLIERLGMIRTWFFEGAPARFWISGFFFTQAFLTAAMQTYARKTKIPIDRLMFDCAVLGKIAENRDDEVVIYGMFVDGARWNAQKSILDEQHPKVLVETMPEIRLYSVLKEEFEPAGRYECPVYKTAERRGTISTIGHSTNFVFSVMLPCEKSSDFWTKRSAALLLQLSN